MKIKAQTTKNDTRVSFVTVSELQQTFLAIGSFAETDIKVEW